LPKLNICGAIPSGPLRTKRKTNMDCPHSDRGTTAKKKIPFQLIVPKIVPQ
jgi:hypothetical protein